MTIRDNMVLDHLAQDDLGLPVFLMGCNTSYRTSRFQPLRSYPVLGSVQAFVSSSSPNRDTDLCKQTSDMRGSVHPSCRRAGPRLTSIVCPIGQSQGPHNL